MTRNPAAPPACAKRDSRRRSDLSSYPQHVYPKRLLSALMYALTRIRYARWKNWQIRWFIARYGVDMDIAIDRQPSDYADFNSFFTRPLMPGARPIEGGEGSIVSPADGKVSQAGPITHGALVQAKNRDYSVADLLGGDEAAAERYRDGAYITVYLAPRDYHRVHMPLAGALTSMTYAPGALFSVNPATASSVRELFARNERVISHFDTPLGPLGMVMVGAVFVGGIEQVWCGPVTPASSRTVRRWNYPEGFVHLAQGEEFGRFNMGSTVVMLLGNPAVTFEDWIQPGRALRMGQRIAVTRDVSRATRTD